jgi:hypothetical protein
MPINQYQRPEAGIGNVLTALQAVHTLYGIDTTIAQKKLMESELAQKQMALKAAQEENQPDSLASQRARVEDSFGSKRTEDALNIPGYSSALAKVTQEQPNDINPVYDKDGNIVSADAYAHPGATAAQIKGGQDSYLQKLAIAHESAQRMNAMAGVRQGGVEEQIHKDALAPIQQHINNYTSVMGSLATLDDPNVTNAKVKDHLEKLVAANAGMGRNTTSDAKLKFAIPGYSGTNMNDVLTYLGDNPDLPAASSLLSYTRGFGKETIGNLANTIKSTAQGQAQSMQFSDPNNNSIVQKTLNPYISGSWFKGTDKNYFPGGRPAWTTEKGGKAPSAPQSAFAPHPADSDAVTWAKQNPKDPNAQKILQMNGVQ